MNKTTRGALALAAGLALASPAFAQNKPDERVRGLKLKQIRAVGAQGRARVAPKQLPTGFPLPAGAEREIAKSRLRKQLKRPITADVAAQQKLHALRIAKLERIKALAEAERDSRTLERVGSLTAKENSRFAKWLERAALKGGANK